MSKERGGLVTVLLAVTVLWGVNFIWLRLDTRPPVWDMALHQSYALNYLPTGPGSAEALPLMSRSGNYPPLVHLMIAFCYLVFYPDPHIAVLANIPASVLLIGSIYVLGVNLAGARAARWACLLTVLTPYLIWMSRETVLDYWLSAWVAAGLVALRKTDRFHSHRWSIFFGLICALGLLTKWFFAGFLFFPVLYVCIRSRIWREPGRVIHFVDSLLVAGVIAGVWYLANIPNLVRYLPENLKIGALEGEPPVFSFQSFIYYLRLLEGYQLFGILFLVVVLSCVFVWRRRLLRDGGFLLAAVCGGWLVMTLLRTKDARFTMPLLGLLAIIAGAWLQSWSSAWWARVLKVSLVFVLGFQAYAANFGVRWLPEAVVLAPGYSGSVRWDWNLYLQNFFHICGPPRAEDWKLAAILRDVAEHSRSKRVGPTLALIPDLPFFNSTTFGLMARLRGLPVHVDQLKTKPNGIRAFDGYNYVVVTERDQGIAWTTHRSGALNQIVVDNPLVFRLVGLYLIPGDNCARLYFVHRSEETRN
ncbi:MAG: glycosyltransferase family 39 protein [Acidobacteriota bacterium]